MAENSGVLLAAAYAKFYADYAEVRKGAQEAVKHVKGVSEEMRRTATITRNTSRTIGSSLRSGVMVGVTSLKMLKASLISSIKLLGSMSFAARKWMNKLTSVFVFLQLDLRYITRLIRQMSLIFVGGLTAMIYASTSFEQAFVRVRKVVDMTSKDLDQLAQNIRLLSTDISTSAVELANLASIGGQLGIEGVQNLTKFTDVMSKLQLATRIAGEQGAAQLARFMEIMRVSIDDVDRLGSAIVHLGNNFAAFEDEILEMSMRIAGAGQAVGIASEEVLALGTALVSVGVHAQAGGTAMSRILLRMQDATSKQTAELWHFAKVSEMAMKDFVETFRSDPIKAVEMFIKGLQNVREAGGDVVRILDAVGFSEIRVRDAILRLIPAADTLSNALNTAATGWTENVALQEEYERAMDTVIAQLRLLWNTIVAVAASIGDLYTPYLREAISTLRTFAETLLSLDDRQRKLIANFFSFTGAILLVGTGILAVVMNILVLLTFLTLLARAFLSITGVAAFMGKVFLFLMTPLGLATFAVGLFFSLIDIDLLELLKGSVENLKTGFNNLKSSVEPVTDVLKVWWQSLRDIWSDEDLTSFEKFINSMGPTFDLVITIGKFIWKTTENIHDSFLDWFYGYEEIIDVDWSGLQGLPEPTVTIEHPGFVNQIKDAIRQSLGWEEEEPEWFTNLFAERDWRITLKTLAVGFAGFKIIESLVILSKYLKTAFKTIGFLKVFSFGVGALLTIGKIALAFTAFGLLFGDREDSQAFLDGLKDTWNKMMGGETSIAVGILTIAADTFDFSTLTLKKLRDSFADLRENIIQGLADSLEGLKEIPAYLRGDKLLADLSEEAQSLIRLGKSIGDFIKEGILLGLDIITVPYEAIHRAFGAKDEFGEPIPFSIDYADKDFPVIVLGATLSITALSLAKAGAAALLGATIVAAKISLPITLTVGALILGSGVAAAFVEDVRDAYENYKENPSDVLAELPKKLLESFLGGPALAQRTAEFFDAAGRQFAVGTTKTLLTPIKSVADFWKSLGFLQGEGFAQIGSTTVSRRDEDAQSWTDIFTNPFQVFKDLWEAVRQTTVSRRDAEDISEISEVSENMKETSKSLEVTSEHIKQVVSYLAARSRIDPALAKGIAYIESNFRDLEVVTSGEHSVGPMQLNQASLATIEDIETHTGVPVDLQTLGGRIQAGVDYIDVLANVYTPVLKRLIEYSDDVNNLAEAVVVAYRGIGYVINLMRDNKPLGSTDIQRIESYRKFQGYSEGTILPGHGGGDIIPALLEPGEAVIPADIVRQGGGSVLDWFRSQGAPGFQLGSSAVPTPAQAQAEYDKWGDEIESLKEVEKEMLDIFEDTLPGILQVLETIANALINFSIKAIEFIADLIKTLFTLDEEQEHRIDSIVRSMTKFLQDLIPEPPEPKLDKDLEIPNIVGGLKTLYTRLISGYMEEVDESVSLWDTFIGRWTGFMLDFLDPLNFGDYVIGAIKGALDFMNWLINPTKALREFTDYIFGFSDEISGVFNTITESFAGVALHIMDFIRDFSWENFQATLLAGLEQFVFYLGIAGNLAKDAFLGIRRDEDDPDRIIGTAFGDLGNVVASTSLSFMSMINPVAILAEIFTRLVPISEIVAGVFETFEGFDNILEKLKYPLQIVGQILGHLLIPVLQILEPVLNGLAMVVSAVAIVVGDVWNALLNFLAGIWEAIGSLSIFGITLFPAANDLAKALRNLTVDTDEMRELQEKLKKGYEESDDALEKMNQQLRNVPASFRFALERYRAVLPPADIIPSAATGGFVDTGGLVNVHAGEIIVPENKTNSEIHIHFHGSVYGMDDFDKRVKQSIGKISRGNRISSYGLSGGAS